MTTKTIKNMEEFASARVRVAFQGPHYQNILMTL